MLRRRAGLTQQALGDLLGCSLPTVQRLEGGTHAATLARACDIADVLGWSPVELITLVEAVQTIQVDEIDDWLEDLDWIPNPGGLLPKPRLDPAPPPRTAPPPAAASDGGDPAEEGRRRERVLGLLLNQLRLRIGLSREELGVRWGPSPSKVKRLERGAASLDLTELRDLGRLLGLSMVELIALTEHLREVLKEHPFPRRVRAETRQRVVEWFSEELEWEPNPGVGLLPSRPSGFRLRLSVSEAPTPPSLTPAGERADTRPTDEPVTRAWVARDSARVQYQVRPAGLLRSTLVEPAAAALAAELRRGWPVTAVKVPKVSRDHGRIVDLVAVELVRVLDEAGWRAWPAMLVGRGVKKGSPNPAEGKLVRVPARRALIELARGGPDGEPWRLVVVEGLAALQLARFAKKQPDPQLAGASLVVVETGLATRRRQLAPLLRGDRKLCFERSWVEAMDDGLVPGLRFRGVRDPVSVRPPPGFGRWRLPVDEALLDDRRLDALAAAGAFRSSGGCRIHVANADQASWAERWLRRELGAGAGRCRVVLRSVGRVRSDQEVTAVVFLAADYPATLVKQVDAALKLANTEAGLEVWELESADRVAATKRRSGLAAALGAKLAGDKDVDQGRWTSPGGSCSFEWRLG